MSVEMKPWPTVEFVIHKQKRKKEKPSSSAIAPHPFVEKLPSILVKHNGFIDTFRFDRLLSFVMNPN